MKLHSKVNINIWRFDSSSLLSQAGWRRGSRWRTSRWRLSSWPNDPSRISVRTAWWSTLIPHLCLRQEATPRTQTTRADPSCCCLSGGWSYWRAARGWVWRSGDFPAVSSCSGPAATPGCSSQAWRSQTAPAASLLPPRFQVAWRDDGCRPRKPRRCCFCELSAVARWGSAALIVKCWHLLYQSSSVFSGQGISWHSQTSTWFSVCPNEELRNKDIFGKIMLQ